MKKFFVKTCERIAGILSYLFPLFEISSYFGKRVFLSTESLAIETFYIKYVNGPLELYQENMIFAFAFMVGIFFVCSRGYLPLTKFVRFNIIQAILLSIICSCIGQIIEFYCPLFIRESTVGIALRNFIYLGVLVIVIYSSILIIFGRYPRIPVVSEAARIQTQRSY